MAELESKGVSRRGFLKVCTLAAGAVGLPAWAGEKMAEKAASGSRPPVIWLHFQECTGCSESLLRTSAPDVAELILSLVSLDYHETLMVPSGRQAEKSLEESIEKNAGKYVLVIEGAIPTKASGAFCVVGGRTAVDIVKDVASHAGAIIAIGSCASWGGIPSADPNPTGATGAPQVLKGKTVVTLPGCPANPYIFLGTALQFVTFGTLPALDEKARPTFAYGRTIHEHCPRRAHFDAGRFVQQFGDQGHRLGYCLYKRGCKGPATHASCATLHFGEVVDAWPIGLGHPCFGCTEEQLAFRVALHDTVPIERPTPPDTYPGIHEPQGHVGAVATGIAGLAVGAALGAGWRFAKSLGGEPEPPSPQQVDLRKEGASAKKDEGVKP